MGDLSFFKELNESQLLPSVNHLSKFSLRDVADAVFLYLIALYIMKHEFEYAAIASKYAHRTLLNGHFDNFQSGSSDLRMLITALYGHSVIVNNYLSDQASNGILRQRLNINENLIKSYLQSIQNAHLNDNTESRLLLAIQNELNIEVSNYRSIRRLAIDWNDISRNDKQLLITRLLQAFRSRFKRSELLGYLEHLAKEEKLEMHGVTNAETGAEPSDTKSKFGFLKSLGAMAAGVATGMAIKHMANKR